LKTKMCSKPIFFNVFGFSLVRRLSSEVLTKDKLKVGRLVKEPLIQHGPSIKLANRPYLAGSGGDGFPDSMSYANADDCDSYVLQNTLSIANLGVNIRDIIDNRLITKGAVLVRGLDSVIKDASTFSSLVDHLGNRFSYTAGFASRKELDNAPGVVAAADDPPETTIEPHLEMSYNKKMPGKILFYCLSAPSCGGGQTPICDMRKVYSEMIEHRQLLEALLQNGIRYSRFLPSAQSRHKPLYNWEKTFYTEKKEEVENVLTGLGYEVEWRHDNMLHYWYTMTSTRRHPVTQDMIWSNQASVSHGSYYTNLPNSHQLGYFDERTAPSHTSHSDGSELTTSELETMRAIQWKNCRAINWKSGDLLILDNNAVGHGRLGFKPNTGRNIVVSLLK